MPAKSSRALGSLVAVATVATVAVFSLIGRPSAPPTPSPLSPPATVITDREGFSLYRFDESRVPVAHRRTDPRIDPLPDRRLLTCDAENPPDWPAVDYDQIPPDVDRRLLGYLQRADGRRQLTINGCPVYRYRGDRTPGQTSGDGTAGTWFSVTPADLQQPHRSTTFGQTG